MKVSLILSGRKVLITGASGFIGSRLSDRLLREGAEVHGVSRSSQPDIGSPLRWWQANLSDTSEVRKLVNAIRPEFVFHLASHVSGVRSLDAVLPTFHGNLFSAVNLLTAATETGCTRIVLAGSLEEPEPGDPEAVPCAPYAAAKGAASAYARMFHALYQTPVVIARLFMVYGPAQKDLKKLIPYVTLSLLRREAPKLSNGQRPVDWIFLDDVVDGLIAIAQTPNIEGLTVDLGSGKLVSVRSVVERVVDLVDAGIEPLFGAIPERPLERVRTANVDDSAERTGWRPVVSLDEGLARTVSWYRDWLVGTEKSVTETIDEDK